MFVNVQNVVKFTLIQISSFRNINENVLAHSSRGSEAEIEFFFARATPIIFGSSMPLRSLMQLFCNNFFCS